MVLQSIWYKTGIWASIRLRFREHLLWGITYKNLGNKQELTDACGEWRLAIGTMRPDTKQKWSRRSFRSTGLKCWHSPDINPTEPLGCAGKSLIHGGYITLSWQDLLLIPARSLWDDHFRGEAESKPQCFSSAKRADEQNLDSTN